MATRKASFLPSEAKILMEAFEEAQEQIKTGKQHHSHKTKSGNVFQSEWIKIVPFV